MEQQDISLSYGIHRSPSIGNEGELSDAESDTKEWRTGEYTASKRTRHNPSGRIDTYVRASDKGSPSLYLFQTNVLRYADTDGTTHLIGANQYDKIPKAITSIGNTLIVISEDPIRYLLWDGEFYKELGDKPPSLSCHSDW